MGDDEKAKVMEEPDKVAAELRAQGLTVKIDDRDMHPGAKYYEWEMKGVPLRIEIGPKDIEKGSLCLVRRFVLEQEGESEQDQRKRKKTFPPRAEALASVKKLLDEMQGQLLDRAKAMRAKRTRVIDSIADFEKFFNDEGGGFAWVHWAGNAEQEGELAERFKTSVRCIPFEDQIPAEAKGEGKCILTGQPSMHRIVMAKAY